VCRFLSLLHCPLSLILLCCFLVPCSSPIPCSESLFRRIKNAKRSYMQKKEIKFTSIQMLVLVLNWSVLGSAPSAKEWGIEKAGVYFIN